MLILPFRGLGKNSLLQRPRRTRHSRGHRQRDLAHANRPATGVRAAQDRWPPRRPARIQPTIHDHITTKSSFLKYSNERVAGYGSTHHLRAENARIGHPDVFQCGRKCHGERPGPRGRRAKATIDGLSEAGRRGEPLWGTSTTGKPAGRHQV